MPQAKAKGRWRPTRKVFASALGGIITAAAMQFADDAASRYQELQFLTTEASKNGIPVLVMMFVAYMVPDKKE